MGHRRFYRVQSDSSFTDYDATDGFTAKASYWMHYRHWLNRLKIQRHLDWQDRSVQSTPFISVFDNLGDAKRRAEVLKRRGCQGVFIAEILVPNARQSTLEIAYSDRNVILPVLLDGAGTTTFISTPDLREQLGVDIAISEKSEWLALEHIPRNLISSVHG